MTENHHSPTLRERLDAVRPDSDDLADSDLSDVAAAIERSSEWRLLLENQVECDRQIAAAMEDVEFSPDAKQRLLNALAAARESVPDDRPQPSPAAPVRRISRRTLAYLTTAAIGLTACIGLGLLFFGNGAQTLTLDEIRGQVPLAENGQIDPSRLPAFDESFALSLPTGRWERVTFENPRGISWSGDDKHEAALLPFVTTGRHPIRGYLLIVPAPAVSTLPTSTVLTTANVNYFPTENTAWTNSSGDMVYVCFVDPGKIPSLQRLLYPQSV